MMERLEYLGEWIHLMNFSAIFKREDNSDLFSLLYMKAIWKRTCNIRKEFFTIDGSFYHLEVMGCKFLPSCIGIGCDANSSLLN